MVEIHIVDHTNTHHYERELESYFEWRHRIYVEERGWSELRRGDGRERDQFDTDQTVHVLALEGGEIVGGSRLIAASNPTLLGEVFPYLVERGQVPRDRATLEWTRMFVVPSRRIARRKFTVRGALFAGVMDYAVAVGARQTGGVIETFWLPYLAQVGWHPYILGMPRIIAGSMTLAAFVPVSAEALQSVRAATGWTESLLCRRDAPSRRVA